MGAAIVTCALAAATRAEHVLRIGGWAVADVLVIAWARQFPSSPMQLYGLLVLRGPALVRLTVGVNVVFAIFFGVVTMAPELVACAAAALYPTARLRR